MNQKLQQIHEASMRILKNTGMKFHHPEAVKILKEHDIQEKDGVFFFTEDQIMEWIKKAPHEFTFHARNSKYNAIVGGDNVVQAPGYGCPQVCDQTGVRRNATLEDYVKFTKLFHANNFYKVDGGLIVQPNDVPAEHAPEIMHYEAILHSDKCLQTASGGGQEQVETMMEMSKEAYGDLDVPRMLTIVNTNSPLQLDIRMTDTLLGFAKYKQPVVIAACVMAGATGPITLAGTIALTNAEVLATIALSQMIQPSTPVCYAVQSTASDMATGSMAGGSPEGALCYKYGALMAKFYGLPCRGGGAISDARIVNGQAGYESMLTYLSCVQNKMNYIIHSAGIIDGFTSMSYEKLIMDFEINKIVDRYVRDIEINEDTLAEDLIHEIGSDGNYMTAEHTFRFCRKEPFMPIIGTHGTIMHPDKQFEMNIADRIDQLMASYEQPEIAPSTVENLKRILAEHKIDTTLLK